MSQHLRILLDVGLVAERRRGRERLYRLVPERLQPVRARIAHYEHSWDDHHAGLRRHLAQETAT